VDLKEDKVKTEIRRRVFSDMDVIENSGVNGLCKLFLYQHFLISRLSWVFLVHDLNLWFAMELDKRIVRRLKNWAGLYKSCDLGALYRRRSHLGLQLTSIEQLYQHLQLVKCCLLENSSDATVREIYELHKTRVSTFTNRWSGPKELSNLEPVVDHNIRFAGQVGRAGLGSNLGNPYVANPTLQERRSKVTEALTNQREQKYMEHAACLVRQGVWTHWDNVVPFDLSWKNLIYGPGPRVIAFVLNAQINSVRTPDMLKLWGYIPSAECILCKAEKCTLHHILVNCKFALNQGRYTWRHDSVLSSIEVALRKVLGAVNSRVKPDVFADVAKKSFKMSFVREGERKSASSGAKATKQGMLAYANDWQIMVDLQERKMVFPPVIYSTNLRPDIVIWSMMSQAGPGSFFEIQRRPAAGPPSLPWGAGRPAGGGSIFFGEVKNVQIFSAPP